MPFNGTGQFARVYSWVNDAAQGILVDATRTDTDSNDIAAGLSNCMTLDGQSTVLANLPMSNFKFTGLAAGTANTDSVNFGQVFNNPTYAQGFSVTGGAVVMTSATSVTVPTAAAGDNSNQAASTAFATQLAFKAALPGQTGNAGKFLRTDGANAFWVSLGLLARSVRTANAQLVTADLGTLVDITSGTFTQTFDTPANLGSNWYCYLRNSGAGQITIPSSDGVTNWIMYPGECRIFQCDGTTFNSVILTSFYLSTQVSGNFIKPPGYALMKRRLTPGGAGGGGGGGGGSGSCGSNGSGGAGSGGAGGNSGTAIDDYILASTLPASTAFVIGAGGTGGSGGSGGAANPTSGNPGSIGNSGNAGTAGNPTTFGSAGAVYFASASAAASGGPAGTAGSGSNGGGGSGSGGAAASPIATVSFSVSGQGAIVLPSNSGGASSAGSSAGPGTSGGAASLSPSTNTNQAGGAGGAAVSTGGQAGNNGSTPAKAAAGCGGGGGGGGSPSIGTASTSTAAGKGGDGAKGGDGGDGKLEIWGII